MGGSFLRPSSFSIKKKGMHQHLKENSETITFPITEAQTWRKRREKKSPLVSSHSGNQRFSFVLHTPFSSKRCCLVAVSCGRKVAIMIFRKKGVSISIQIVTVITQRRLSSQIP
jgi:hypothetical protein